MQGNEPPTDKSIHAGNLKICIPLEKNKTWNTVMPQQRVTQNTPCRCYVYNVWTWRMITRHKEEYNIMCISMKKTPIIWRFGLFVITDIFRNHFSYPALYMTKRGHLHIGTVCDRCYCFVLVAADSDFFPKGIMRKYPLNHACFLCTNSYFARFVRLYSCTLFPSQHYYQLGLIIRT